MWGGLGHDSVTHRHPHVVLVGMWETVEEAALAEGAQAMWGLHGKNHKGATNHSAYGASWRENETDAHKRFPLSLVPMGGGEMTIAAAPADGAAAREVLPGGQAAVEGGVVSRVPVRPGVGALRRYFDPLQYTPRDQSLLVATSFRTSPRLMKHRRRYTSAGVVPSLCRAPVFRHFTLRPSRPLHALRLWSAPLHTHLAALLHMRIVLSAVGTCVCDWVYTGRV